jgi:polyisoprenoid-binding protein YceI
MRKLLTTTAMTMAAAVMTLAMATSARAEDFKLDPVHSSIYFAIGHLNRTSIAYGRFNEVEGSFTLGEKASFEFTVKAESVDTGNKKRDEHLRGPDFFNVKQFPVITFKSKSVKAADANFTVEGEMTLMGVTKPITIKLEKGHEGKDPWGNHRTGFSTEFTIKRTDYGMSNMVGPVADEVKLFVSFEGIKP